MTQNKYTHLPEVPQTVDIATALIITAAILIHITQIPFTIICMCLLTKLLKWKFAPISNFMQLQITVHN